jgi:hypothetical protein
MSTETPESTTETSPRTFWKSDYAKAARLIKGMRHVRCQPSTPKPDLQMSRVDSLAAAVAAYFEADAPEGGFSTEKFLAGTKLPQASENVILDSPPEGDIEDEDTGDAFEVE